MNWAAPILEHGGLLLAGGSAFLALGLLINLLQRTPILRIRIAEMAVGCALLFAVLTLAPLPRAFAPEPISLSLERTPIQQFDPTPYLSVLANQPSAETPAPALPFIGPNEISAEGPAFTFDEQAMAPLIETPLLFAEDAQAAQAPLPLGKIALVVWLTGAAVAGAWLLLGAWRVRRVLRSSRPAQRHVLHLLREQGVQLPSHVRLRLSDREVRPFCIGALRPTIVIPRSLLEDEQSVSLAPVVHHELAHATQGDARGLWLFAIALLPLWFHPLYWWLRAQHRFSTELVADAIAAGKISNRAYARELVHLVERQAEQATPVMGATALFRKRSDFYQRMQMLLTRNNSLATRTTLRRRALHGFLSLGLLTGAASVGGTAPVSAQEPEQEPAYVINQLRVENTQLRADLQEMQVVLSELKDMLTLMQVQRNADRKAQAQDRLGRDMEILDARERQVDALMQSFDPGSVEQVEALAALGYVLVDDEPGYLPYKVKSGDSMEKIAEMAGLRSQEDLMLIAQLNPHLFSFDEQGRIASVNSLKPGVTVVLPQSGASIPSSGSGNPFATSVSARTHKVKEGESIYSIATQHGLTSLELQKIFIKLNPELVTLDSNGRVSSARPLQVGDKLQIPVSNQLRGSVTTNSVPGLGFRSGTINPGTVRGGRRMAEIDPASATDVLRGNDAQDPRVADGRGVPIISDLPLVGELFRDSNQAGTAQPGAPVHRAPMPSVNLAECMELSFRAIDLQGELELTKAAYENTERLASQSMVSEIELRKARIGVSTLERKYGLSRSVLRARMNDLEQQIDELSAGYTKDHPNFPRREIELREQALAILAESI